MKSEQEKHHAIFETADGIESQFIEIESPMRIYSRVIHKRFHYVLSKQVDSSSPVLVTREYELLEKIGERTQTNIATNEVTIIHLWRYGEVI